MDALPASPHALRADRLAASARAVAMLGAPLWQAGELATLRAPTAATGWPALDAELPGGGWPLAGLSELLLASPAAGELSLLAPWLRALSGRELGARQLLWVAPPADPCVAALQALALPLDRLVCVRPASLADAAWAAEQALRAGSCAAVLWWTGGPTATPMLRRLHLAGQAGTTPLIALRPAATRASSSPAPLRLACAPHAGRRLAVEVFKRRGPPMTAPLFIDLAWPASARPSLLATRPHDAVDRPASAAPAAASPALVAG